MKRGWVKLYRKLLDNEFLRWDTNAFNVFIKILLLVDKKTGEWSGGRYQLGEITGLKPTTAYGATRRLEKAKMMTLRANNKFTTFSICNWQNYQGNGDSTDDIQMTSNRHSNKNKEIENINTNVLIDKSKPELNELIAFAKERGFPLQGTQRTNRLSASNLLKKFGLDKSKRIVEVCLEVRGEPYSPTINDFTALYRKVGDLASFVQKNKNNKPLGREV